MLILCIHFDYPRGLAAFEHLLRLFQKPVRLHRLFVSAFELAHEVGAAFLDTFKVREHQLGFDHTGIGHGVHAAIHMGDVVIFKTAQHMGDGVAFADIGKELVAEPLPLRRAFDEACDVHKGHPRRDDFL